MVVNSVFLLKTFKAYVIIVSNRKGKEILKMQNGKLGVMLDCSRNAVMKPEQIKKFVDYISAFGYNMLELYTEDTLETVDEPYFGYMRGRYTAAEIKDIDEYCKSKGVELIPCIQTLAHLGCIFRWGDYEKIRDVNDILLIGEERTYAFIENIFTSLERNFTSRTVNIGMDEAHLVGLGKYLDKHGYRDRFGLLKEHLERVISIAKEHGFKPVMWSDMFFRLAAHGDYYGNVKGAAEFLKDKVPEGVGLTYWDYYHTEKRTYDQMNKEHKALDGDSWFAGGAWTWHGFAPFNAWTMKTMRPAMLSAKDHGVNNILITMWGDNGKECSFYSVLPSLYFIAETYRGETSLKKIKENFNEITGENFDAFMKLDTPNYIGGNKANFNPCKYMLYNDLLTGIYDVYVPAGTAAEYKKHAAAIKRAGKNSKFKYIFECLYRLCDLLAVKSELGKKIRAAYNSGDKEELRKLVAEIKKCEVKLDRFYPSFAEVWKRENKPFGFEVQDARLGGLKRRLITVRERLTEYLDGKADVIPELEETLLKHDELVLASDGVWTRIVSANNV